MRYVHFIVLLLLSAISTAQACEKIDKPDVRFRMTIPSHDGDHCFNFELFVPSGIGSLHATVPRLVGISKSGYAVTAHLSTSWYVAGEKELPLMFCLNEQALKESKVIVEYHSFPESGQGACFKKIELDNLKELLSESDKELLSITDKQELKDIFLKRWDIK